MSPPHNPDRPAPGHDRWGEDVAAWLLGALPPEDREAFEAHLAACPVCRAEAESLGIAADALPGAAPPLRPPPELKGRIMAVVESEAALLAAAAPPASAPQPPPRRRRLVLGLPRWVLAPVAAALLLLVGGVGGALLAQDEGPATRTVAASVAPPGSRVTLQIEGDDADLVARGLPELSGRRVYQLWVLPEGPDAAPVPTDAVFLPRPDGTAVVAVPEPLEDVAQVLVTSEDGPGATVPGEEPIIAVSPA